MTRIFSIPPTKPFQPVLLDALFSGEITGDPIDGSDPLALADVKIYVPTRRAVRSLTQHIMERNRRASILPDIRAIGDIDDGDDAFDLPVDPLTQNLTVPTKPQQLFLMAGLISRWKKDFDPALAEDLPDLPVSPADALWLASDLLQLIKTAQTEQLDWSKLDTLVPEDYAEYWQMTLAFLQTARRDWPQTMATHGFIDPAVLRDQQMRDYAAELETKKPRTPVILAGSTGSVPATAELMRTIANLPKGAIILPGLDNHLDYESWQTIGGKEVADPCPSHPQFNMKLLLERLGVNRRDVIHLGGKMTQSEHSRLNFLAELMRPAKTTHLWSGYHSRRDNESANTLFDALSLVEADTIHEEARTIALAIRRALEEDASTTISVITPDRRLAQQILEEGSRWSLDLDDSSGMPLSKTAPGVLFRLLAECAANGLRPTPFLSLAKHPLAAFGLDKNVKERATSTLDKFALRGPQLVPGFDAIFQALELSNDISDVDREEAALLLNKMRESLAPLAQLSQKDLCTPIECMDAHRGAFSNVLIGLDEQNVSLAHRDELEAFLSYLEDYSHLLPTPFEFTLADFPRCLDALLSSESYRVRRTKRHNIQIFGSVEARMQNAELTILGGLNEGSWPSSPSTGPWLSRSMMDQFGLPVPERRVGLSAHDFIQALGGSQIILTRSLMSGGAPAVPSRFWMRMETVAGSTVLEPARQRGKELIRLVRSLDPGKAAQTAPRPRPSPPIDARPKSLSVTEIETLFRDPYALYAKRILGLRPLEAIGEDPGARDRGIMIHEIVAEAIRQGIKGTTEKDQKALDEIARDVFKPLSRMPDVYGIWWPRYEALSRPFLEWNERRHQEVDKILVEDSGIIILKLPTGTDFYLRARADRIEIAQDGGLHIFDFKTGKPPSKKLVTEKLLSPQLPLEAYIAQSGGFSHKEQSAVASLTYLAVGQPSDPFTLSIMAENEEKSGQCISSTLERLIRLLTYFEDEKTEYLSRRMPQKANSFDGDYDHLARAREWSSDGADAE